MTLMTNAFQVTSDRWADLGAGPLTVAATGPEWTDIALVVSDAQPPGGLRDGEALRGSRFFAGSTHVWALALRDVARVVVTSPDGGASAGSAVGGGSSATGIGYSASGKAAVAGTFAAAGQSASFAPLAGRAFNISLWGTFTAAVQLERSFDTVNWLPITAAGAQLYAWTSPASESDQDDEAGVFYRLNCTAYTSGTINYRVSQ